MKKAFICSLAALIVLLSLSACERRPNQDEVISPQPPDDDVIVKTEVVPTPDPKPMDHSEEATAPATTEPTTPNPVPDAAPSPAGEQTPPPTSPAQDTAPAASTPDPAQEAKLTGKRLANNGTTFGMPTQSVLGVEDDLAAWNNAISQRDKVAKILLSTWEPERDLTEAEVLSILDTLENLTPVVLEKMGNPPTGGDTGIIAYDSSGTALWRITMNDSWFIVCISSDNTPRLFGIEGQDFSPIREVCS